MVQDFAKIKPEPVLEHRPTEAPPPWMLLFTGLVTGMAVGVFACFLFYLSGYVPPLQTNPRLVSVPEETMDQPAAEIAGQTEETTEDSPIELEFYEELQNYEVTVNATPVEIVNNTDDAPISGAGFMLQSGAYEQRASAENQRDRVRALGLNTVVKQQSFPGRTLYLVQSGPFNNSTALNDATDLLRRNSINSIKISLQ